jgi:ElaB/YqjD/DUF883 family membrane-anchored ribosome-binding protein
MATMDQEGGSVRDRLLSDLKLIIKDAEGLLRNSSQTGDSYQAVLGHLASTLGMAKDSLSGMEQQLMESGREAVAQAENYVKQNPWQAIGMGAAAGLLIGLMLGRK